MREHDYHVYMVKCSDQSYYTGVTNNVERRVREHNEGKDPLSYTFKRRPVALVYSCHFQYIYDAIAWEKHLKRWSRKKKEALIKRDEEALHKYSECMNETHFKNQLPPVVPSGDEG